MKILASSTLLFAYRFEDLIPLAMALGYDGVEAWHFHQLETHEDPSTLAKAAQTNGALLTTHALSWDLNFCSALKSVRETSLEALRSSIKFGRDTGSKVVVIHPGNTTIPGGTPERSWNYLVEGVTNLCDFARTCEVEVSLEVMEHIPKEFFINPADAHHLLSMISPENLSITLDTAHAPLELDLVDYLRETPRVEHIHISDNRPGKRHVPLGEGSLDFGPFLAYLKKEKPEINLAVEGLTFERTPKLAEGNIAFLKKVLSAN